MMIGFGMEVMAIPYRLLALLTLCLPVSPALDAATATVFAAKRGRPVAHTGESSHVVLLPGVDIPAGALVEVPSGVLGVKLPDGTVAYFSGGTRFRLSLPDGRDQKPEIMLLSGGLVLASSESDFVVRCAAGTADVGDCTAAIAYSPGPGTAPGVMMVRVAAGTVGVNVSGAGALRLAKGDERVFSAIEVRAPGRIDATMESAVIAASKGRVPALRTSVAIPSMPASPVVVDPPQK